MAARTWKRLLVAGLMAGMLVAVPSVEAQRRPNNNKCVQRIRQAESNLQRAIQRHGQRSKQAAKRRRQLEMARERCGNL
jgi:hemolysin activation/secretion protein